MKKIVLAAVMALSMVALSAQVMGSNGVKNTLWSGFGTPDSDNRDVTWYGFTDTLQARVDVAQFTIEGMINWNLFTSWDGETRNLSYTKKTPFYAANRGSDAYGSPIDNSYTDAYYVNFLWHPIKGLDIGAGTRLEWKVGAAPACSDYYWGKGAHVKEGGLKYDYPGATDVAGFVYYPNTYSSTIGNYTAPGALGIRYNYNNIVEVGVCAPSGTSTEDFSFNAGIKVQPIDLFAVSVAYEGICKSEGYLYAGVQMFLAKNFTLNGFFAMDKLGGDESVKNGVNGFGFSAVYAAKALPLTITPEFGMTFYENDNYGNAFYVGSGFDYTVNKQFKAGVYTSFSWGAKDKRWETIPVSKNYIGGNVFAIRPTLSMDVNNNNNITLYADYQSRTAFTGNQYNSWAAGAYWTYRR